MRIGATFVIFVGLSSVAQAQPAPKPPACNSYVLQKTIDESPEKLAFKQRLCIYGGKVFSGQSIFGSVYFAGVAQMRDDPVEWGQGTRGYLRRTGSRFAQGVAKTTGEFIFSSLLHENPRYLPSPDRGFWKRTGHALNSVFMVEHLSSDRPVSGKRRKWLAVSKMVGAASSGLVGLAWYPDRLNTPGQVLARTGSAYGGYFASAIFLEFQGDIFRSLGKLLGSDRSSSTKMSGIKGMN